MARQAAIRDVLSRSADACAQTASNLPAEASETMSCSWKRSSDICENILHLCMDVTNLGSPRHDACPQLLEKPLLLARVISLHSKKITSIDCRIQQTA